MHSWPDLVFFHAKISLSSDNKEGPIACERSESDLLGLYSTWSNIKNLI